MIEIGRQDFLRKKVRSFDLEAQPVYIPANDVFVFFVLNESFLERKKGCKLPGGWNRADMETKFPFPWRGI